MSRRLAVVALVCCVLLAGCSGFPGGSPDGDAAGRDDSDLAVTEGPPYPDPWPGSPTVVAIDATATDGRPVEGLVADALAYWARNDDRYADYTTTFVLRPNATDPDVVVEFVPNLTACGADHNETTVGCAPVLSTQALADRPTTVRVETGYTNASTTLILKHEFGHVLGLDHSDEPTLLMVAWTDRLQTFPQPDATDRALPWNDATLSVYVDRATLPGSDAQIDRQIGAAMAYYNGGADGYVPAELSLTRTDDRAAADIVVTGRDLDRQSNETLLGESVDTDPAIEYYTHQTILIDTDLDPATLGWHVGFYLGDSLVAPDRIADLPPPFDDPRTDDRREWW